MRRQAQPRAGRGGRGGHEPRARIRARAHRVIELAVRGWSQHAIADDVGISQAAVSKILARVETRVLREHEETVDRHKARQALRLNHLYAEALHAWDQSKVDSTRRRQRQTQRGSEASGVTVAEVTAETQHGDARYLAEARKALADDRKLWGLEAPQTVDLVARRNPFQALSEDALRAALSQQARWLEPHADADSERDRDHDHRAAPEAAHGGESREP